MKYLPASQKEQVLAYLLHNTCITPAIARAEFGIERLAARIYELRQDGWNIRRQIKRSFTGKPYASYWLEQRSSS